MTRQTCTFCNADLGPTDYRLEEKRSLRHLRNDCPALKEDDRRWLYDYGAGEIVHAITQVRKTSAQLQAEVREFCEEGDPHPYRPDPYDQDDDRLPGCDQCGAGPLSPIHGGKA